MVVRALRRPVVVGLMAICLAAVAAGCSVGSSGGSSGSAGRSNATQQSACQVESVANTVLPSVVTINARGAEAGGGTGSGEVIRSDGYILTNNHVISVAANGGAVSVLFSDGVSVPATITGRDPQTDLAVLHVEPPHDLKVIAIGSSDTVKVGQPVVALGAPLGLSGTVTAGIVSALDRTVNVPGDNGGQALLVSAVQTDAAINPGNSGGALVNCAGRLIGVPTAGATVPSPSGESAGGSIGLGFAIPVDLAMSIAKEIIATGTVTHAYFGLQTVPIPPAAAAQAGTAGGLYVTGVAPNGPAAQAGLEAGDIITSIDGTAATSNDQLESLSLSRKAGDTVTIEYVRAEQTTKATITLGARPG
jgi:putative serine protease PepD